MLIIKKIKQNDYFYVIALALSIILVAFIAASLSNHGNVKTGSNSTPSKINKNSLNKSAVSSQNGNNPNGSASTKELSINKSAGSSQNGNNSNGSASTKELSIVSIIPYSVQYQNEVNMKRGTTMVSQQGINGSDNTKYLVTYDNSGKETSRNKISDTVIVSPVNQIIKLGVSDFNLNSDIWTANEWGDACLLIEFNQNNDGCFGVPSELNFASITISGSHYIYCIKNLNLSFCNYDPLDVNVHPVIPVNNDDAFSYNNQTYKIDPRKGGPALGQLNFSSCSQYGLSCGVW
jgi:G5 domain